MPRSVNLSDVLNKTKIIWIAACSFYSFQLFLRVLPNILADDLMRDFGLNAYQLGLLSSCYYNAYALVQLPAGILLDRFSVRLILSLSLTCCLVGTILFIASSNIYIAGFARFITGFGAGFALLSSIKAANSIGFSPKKLSLMIGGNFMIAMLLVGASGSVINYLINQFGWRIGIAMLLIMLVIMLGLCLYAKEKKPKASSKSSREILQEIVQDCIKVLQNRQLYVISLYGFLTYVPLSCFCDLWGSKFLNTVYGIEYSQAISMCMTIYIGVAVGSIVWPAICAFMKSYKFSLIFSKIMIFCCFVSILYFRDYVNSITALYSIMFSMGFFASTTLLPYAMLSEIYGKELSATANGVYNVCAMLTGVIMQPVIGKILDCLSADRGEIIASDFISAFVIFCITTGMGVIVACFVKDQYDRR